MSFTMVVGFWAYGGGALTYEGTPNSEALSRELIDEVDRAKFIPALYHGEKVTALVNGTVVFAISADGKPHLRIFLHQDRERLARGEDFIAPQLLFPMNTKFKWFDSASIVSDQEWWRQRSVWMRLGSCWPQR